jgi:hypothetical protein
MLHRIGAATIVLCGTLLPSTSGGCAADARGSIRVRGPSGIGTIISLARVNWTPCTRVMRVTKTPLCICQM